MRYYYVPSTYKGRRFGSGLRGGALRGLGFLAGGSLKGGFTSIPVVPTQIAQIATKPEQVAAVQAAETTGQPASIGKRLYDLWGRAKNVTIGDIANGIGSAAKTGLKYALPIMGAYTGYKLWLD